MLENPLEPIVLTREKSIGLGNQQTTPYEIGWLAGIIDGEGHIGLSRQNTKKCRSVRPDVQIVNCDYEVIKKIVDVLHKMGINPYIRERLHDKKEWRKNYIVTVGKFSHIKKLMDSIVEYLTGEKKYRAELMMKLINKRILKTRFDRYSEDELAIISEFFEHRDGVSTTARKTPERVMIQSGLMGNHERMAEMTIPSFAFQCVR